MTLEMMLLSKVALESKKKGRCSGCCCQTFVGPCHCWCVVTANPHFIIGEGVLMCNESGLGDDVGKLQIRVGDATPEVVIGDELQLDMGREWCPPNIRSAKAAGLWLRVSKHCWYPYAPHTQFRCINGSDISWRSGDMVA